MDHGRLARTGIVRGAQIIRNAGCCRRTSYSCPRRFATTGDEEGCRRVKGAVERNGRRCEIFGQADAAAVRLEAKSEKAGMVIPMPRSAVLRDIAGAPVGVRRGIGAVVRSRARRSGWKHRLYDLG